MKNLLTVLFATVVLLWNCVSIEAQTANAAESDCLCIASSQVRKYCDRENSGRAKSATRAAQERVAKRDIQELINGGIEADEAKDETASNYIFTSDYTIKDLNGKVWTTAEMKGKKGASGQHYAGILKISDRTRIAIECLTLNGPEATVYTNQHFVRYVPDRKDGSPHEVITNIVHREIWIFTEKGWRCKFIEELERGGTFLNGQPF